jgi:hypothetical protein
LGNKYAEQTTNEESNERYKRTFRFRLIALAVMLLNGLLDLKRGLTILVYLF